ncbi:MAG: hypothetical protein WAV15_01300 [Minisyncoccia bacterium]
MLFFSQAVFAVWDGANYDPGETLNPECAPTDALCDVVAPLTAANISDTVYGVGWNADTTHAPSKNAIYDKIETLGTGTVTSVSVVTANGVSGSVATATSTPAITLTLGAITPTSVKAGTLTTADALADNYFATTATTQKGLVIQGKASQTANLQEWQKSTGVAPIFINAAADTIARTDASLTIGPTSTDFLQLQGGGIVASVTNLDGYGVGVSATRPLGFWPSTTPAALDTAFSRISAGVIGVGTGAAGSYAGTLKLANADIVSGTVTTSAPALSLTQTWNGAGVAFTGAVLNYTATAASTGSKYLDFQKSGSTRMSFRDGSNTGGSAITLSGSGTNVGLGLSYSDVAAYAPYIYFDVYNIRANLGSVGTFGWASSSDASGASDTGLSRISAGVIGVGTGAAGSVAGTLQAANFYAGTSLATGSNGVYFGSDTATYRGRLYYSANGILQVLDHTSNAYADLKTGFTQLFGTSQATNSVSLSYGGSGILQVGTGAEGSVAGTISVAKSLFGTATTADALADNLFATSATTQKGLVIQGKLSQTADLQQWQNSSGTAQAVVRPDGSAYFNGPLSDTVFSGNAFTGTYSIAGGQGYWAFRTGTAKDFNIDVYNAASPFAALTVLQGGNVGIRDTTPDALFDIDQPVSTSGSPTGLGFTGGAHTTLTASTEASDINFNLARTVQFATGALATQRAVQITAPTYAFAGASTLTRASTVGIVGAPIAGTNATITNRHMLSLIATSDTDTTSGLYIRAGTTGGGIGSALKIDDPSGTTTLMEVRYSDITFSGARITIGGSAINLGANTGASAGILNFSGGYGDIRTVGTGATDTYLRLSTYTTGTGGHIVLMPAALGGGGSGNVKIAGTAVRATTEGSNHLDIFDGTAPAGTLTNGISLYSTAGELRVMDAAGNATLLSPHENINNYWVFDSANSETGKTLVIDMELIIKDLNDSLDLDYVHETQDGELVDRGEGSILSKIFAKVSEWFASAGNGIGDFFANRVRTKELCVGDDAGETCITRGQLDALLINAGNPSASSGSSTTSTTTDVTTSTPSSTDSLGSSTTGDAAPVSTSDTTTDSSTSSGQAATTDTTTTTTDPAVTASDPAPADTTTTTDTASVTDTTTISDPMPAPEVAP